MDVSAFAYDFFLSRRGSVAAVAQEVADVLEAAGYRVRVQDYDFAASGQFVRDIDDALKQARDLLILYSRDYHGSFWTRQEFHNFLAAVAAANGTRRIGLLRCDDDNPPGLLHSVTYGDLHTVTDPAARRRIILAVARGEAPAARPTPRIFGGAMPPENRLFTGRESELDAVHTALSSGTGRAALTQAAVHGLGGVGKTSLARAYVARFEAEYGGVWWITATDKLAIQTGLLDLARALDPTLPVDARLEDAAAKALATLAARRGETPFLLVYDNVPSPELLDALVPPRGAAVLVTSRAPDWSGVAQEVFVDTLPEDAAVDFLQRRTERQDADGARRLAVALGCLPLALDHAGAYVKRAGIGFDAYAQRVAERIQAEPPRGVAYPRSVAATFALAIEEAAREAPAAETLLGLFAWLAPEAIPLALADAEVMPEAAREAAVMALRGVSLLTLAPEGACGPAVSVHRLVQAVMRARLAERSGTEAARTGALAALDRAFPDDTYQDPTNWPRCRELMPHLRTLLEHLGDEHSLTLANLSTKADNYLDGSGASADAVFFSRRALAAREHVLGPEHPDTLGSVNNLASCMWALGDAAGALPLYRRALDSSERVLGKEHPDTLTSVNNLAACMQALGDAAGALPLCRRALDSSERVLGKEHPSTLRSTNNLAGVMGALGDAAAALPLYRRALDSFERVLGKEHPNTLISVNNVAECMQALDDTEEALPLFRRALDIRERVLGKEHPDTLTSVNNLAGCLYKLGDAAEALPLFRRALDGRERVQGKEHPATLGSVNNLAACMEALGDAAGALPLYRRALDSHERVLGKEHPDTLGSVNNLALCMQALGDTAGALPLFHHALDSSERVLGKEHPATLTSVNNLAGCMLALGDAAGALPLYRRAADGLERLLRPDHPTSRTVRANYDRLEREVAAARRGPTR
jgi:tetratricopeptide (TPR) repeat protein